MDPVECLIWANGKSNGSPARARIFGQGLAVFAHRAVRSTPSSLLLAYFAHQQQVAAAPPAGVH